MELETKIIREKMPPLNVSGFWSQPDLSWKPDTLILTLSDPKKLPFRSSGSCKMRMKIVSFRVIVRIK